MIVENLIETFDPKLGKIFTQIIRYSDGSVYKRIFWPQFDSVKPYKSIRLYERISIKPKQKD